ncbi:hypothetical protein SAMN05421734_104168 [Pelagirhabdus alkalitolerans]|uniref:Permease n=1 Tax=Pelagirhabdus alkalitolerans TaxID=1612202 RepID=A0A1G6IXP7_9BACI|nr:AEC family transporter [Pelagirhabdus alkalitolerans]SDC11254.1 hypothetical protein SAMN05421734_104168 [Pelagirhabdus alkalitolerans]
MSELILILREIIGPVFVMVLIGFIMQIKFKLDLSSLAKINIYFLAPGFIFDALYHTELSQQLFSQVILFFLVFVGVVYIVSQVSGKLLGLDKDKQTLFTNGAMFFNSGNYGIPVNALVFQGDPYAMSIQVVALTFQDIFVFSYGIFSLRAAKAGRLKALLGYFKMPVLYGLLAGIGFNVLNIDLPDIVLVPADYVSNAMVAMALLTLGAQVSVINFKKAIWTVYANVLIRLLVGPLIALVIIFVMGIDGVMAQALLISSAMPTAVNSAIIAQEYSDYPDFAAQLVLFSTIFSSVTVTMVIFAARLLF